jgi:hypothetical protein
VRSSAAASSTVSKNGSVASEIGVPLKAYAVAQVRRTASSALAAPLQIRECGRVPRARVWSCPAYRATDVPASATWKACLTLRNHVSEVCYWLKIFHPPPWRIFIHPPRAGVQPVPLQAAQAGTPSTPSRTEGQLCMRLAPCQHVTWSPVAKQVERQLESRLAWPTSVGCTGIAGSIGRSCVSRHKREPPGSIHPS